MSTLRYYQEKFDEAATRSADNELSEVRKEAFNTFGRLGIPNSKNEEWKYTRISQLFNQRLAIPGTTSSEELSAGQLNALRLPGHGKCNELVFLNGLFSSSLSTIRSANLQVLPLEQAASGEFKQVVETHFGHSAGYHRDGIHALNTAFLNGAIFAQVKGELEHLIYIYNITDARTEAVLAQPRSLFYVTENARVQVIENYSTIGDSASFTNQVMEVVIEKDAMVEYYKIQNDSNVSNLVSTTHFRMVGKSHLHAVTISLDGAIVRNNLNVVLEAEHCEAHMYGLYFHEGKSHIDNHTVVDNVKPNCFSNELYKGVMKGDSTAVFNGKIFVRAQAQKTNAYQSNKNVLLSDSATVNSKPQLEISADDVKCSHGCTVGQLDEEGLFYLRSRGIGEDKARALLVRSFATDIVEHIKPPAIHGYVEELISNRLEKGA